MILFHDGLISYDVAITAKLLAFTYGQWLLSIQDDDLAKRIPGANATPGFDSGTLNGE